jgi:hypothetical protein
MSNSSLLSLMNVKGTVQTSMPPYTKESRQPKTACKRGISQGIPRKEINNMGKIYRAPEECLKKPEYSQYKDFNKYQNAREKYIADIQSWAKSQNPSCPESGKEICFPVADGQARYIVVSLKPVCLIHDDTGDAYSYQYAHRLTAADVRKEIKKVEAMNKLFGGKRR